MSDPTIVLETRADVKKDYVCSYCGASRRADVSWERTDKFEICITIECTGFLPGGVERCGHCEIRYVAG